MFEKSLKEYNMLICEGIQDYLGCDVVKSNITSQIPSYPYVSFSITSIQMHEGTYGNDGTDKFNAAEVAYSWTVQSDDDYEAWELAQKLHDWFDETGRMYLKDNGMTFVNAGAITERDNMITIEYEYRKGFDVVLNLFNFVDQPEETIETFEPVYEE